MEVYSNLSVADPNYWALNATLTTQPVQLFDANMANITSLCALRKTMESLVVTVAFTIIFCLSVVGNSVVIVTIVQQRTMRTITNLYLVRATLASSHFVQIYYAHPFQLNLAVTDLMLSVICMPPTLVSSLVYCWIFGPLLCKVFAYLQRKSVFYASMKSSFAILSLRRLPSVGARQPAARHQQTRSAKPRRLFGHFVER